MTARNKNQVVRGDLAERLIDAREFPADEHPPAGALIAVREGERALVSVAGSARMSDSAGESEPMRSDHVHDLASVSKLLTTLTVQVLISRGTLRSEDTLATFFGDAAGEYRDVTVSDLLRHRSGMRPWWPLYLVPGDRIRTILSLAPAYAPRTQVAYSDLGMQTLGAVIAQVTQLPFERAVRELVLDPLGAHTVTAASPHDLGLAVSGGWGDDVEREMIETGKPYDVTAEIRDRAAAFDWREYIVRGEVGDCNAFHAFGGVAGHAGWFGDADGLLKVAGALSTPTLLGIEPSSIASQLRAEQPQPEASYAQLAGVRSCTLPWGGVERTFFAHPGFTGTFLAASPATSEAPEVLAVMLTNRLHGAPPPGRTELASVDAMWRRAMGMADAALHTRAIGEAQ